MAKPKQLPGAVIGSGEPRFRKPKLSFRGFFVAIRRHFSQLTRHARIILIIVAVVLISGISFYFISGRNKPAPAAKPSAKAVCSDDVMKKASLILAPEKFAELKPVVDQIDTLPDHDLDPNCLNIVTTYYTNISDLDNAQKSLDLLVKVYDPNKAFNANLGSQAKSLDNLKASVSFLQDLKKQAMENMQKLNSGQTKK